MNPPVIVMGHVVKLEQTMHSGFDMQQTKEGNRPNFTHNVQALLQHHFNLRRFPYDVQHLVVRFALDEAKDKYCTIDHEACVVTGLDEIAMRDWTIFDKVLIRTSDTVAEAALAADTMSSFECNVSEPCPPLCAFILKPPTDFLTKPFVEFRIPLVRNSLGYVVDIELLSALLVSCSVACFWVDPSQHVERLMLLGMFALCFILSKQTAHNSMPTGEPSLCLLVCWPPPSLVRTRYLRCLCCLSLRHVCPQLLQQYRI